MSLTIYPLTYRAKLKVGELTLTVAPMSHGDRVACLAHQSTSAGSVLLQAELMAHEAVKRCVKKIEGVKNVDGTPYECDFEDESGHLTDQCASEILSLDSQLKVALASLSRKFDDPGLEGVKFQTFDPEKVDSGPRSPKKK